MGEQQQAVETVQRRVTDAIERVRRYLDIRGPERADEVLVDDAWSDADAHGELILADLRTMLAEHDRLVGAVLGQCYCHGSDRPHARHLPCDKGCQPDWHRDDCAIYVRTPPTSAVQS